MNKKFKSILAFGDSVVAGFESWPENEEHFLLYKNGKITLEELDDYGKPNSFPNILARKLNIPCYNFALTGGSNDRSLRLLTKQASKYDDCLILFGYTGTARKEFYYPDNGKYLARDNDSFIQVGPQWAEHSHEFDKVIHPINDVYLREICRPYNNLYETMICVEAISKLYKHHVIHIPIFPEVVPDIVDNIIYFEGKGNYFDWCKHKGFIYTKREHYDYKSHIAVSDLINTHLQSIECITLS